MSALPPAPTPPPRPFPVARLLTGVFLLLLGLGWLLDSLDVVHLDWQAVLPVALILLGVTLAAAAWRGGGHGGLIALGIVLTVVLTVGTVVDLPLGGGIGDRTERPQSVNALDDRYELLIGKLTLDLTLLPLTSDTQELVRAQVGMGELIVIVPESMRMPPIQAKAGIGEVQLFDRTEGGLAVKDDEPGESGAPVRLELSVGIGQVEVRYG
jgi:hypothetical protein